MKDTTNAYLTFRLGDELFAASVQCVLEILEVPKITKIPRAPSYMRGVVNLRGQVLSVVDSRTRFGLPTVDDTINTCIVVMSIEQDEKPVTLGFVVDDVKEVITIDRGAIQELPAMGSKYTIDFIEGTVKVGDQIILVLDLNLLFSSSELTVIQEDEASIHS